MDEQSLYQLDQSAILIVPTGSLATHLNEVFATQQIQRGKHVWEAPNILSWKEVLKLYWQKNRTDFANFDTLLSPQQAKLIWTQVIEKSKVDNSDLTLLNAQQTVRACMRSHRLLSDWRCDSNALQLEHISDVDQFLEWRLEYISRLEQRGVTDDPGLQAAIIDHIQQGRFESLANKVIWYAYDLVTASQTLFNSCLSESGVELTIAGPEARNRTRNYHRFQDDKQELYSVFERARTALEQSPDQRINIVVPDLQYRYVQVQEIAHQVFYPSSSLIEAQNNNLVYRFSLGKPMHQWPSIEVALCALSLLKSRLAISDIGFLFRSVYLNAIVSDKELFLGFERWLREKRIRVLSFEQLPVLCSEYAETLAGEEGFARDSAGAPLDTSAAKANVKTQALLEFVDSLLAFKAELNEQLAAQKQSIGFPALDFSAWSSVFSRWLALWGWQTCGSSSQLSSVTHQLQERWEASLDELSSLGAVQRTIGLSGALSVFQQIIRDAVFLPKSAVSPVMISGLFEALGHESDLCFLTGMTQDFPPVGKSDAFIPNQYLLPTGYPDASPQSSVRQAAKVIESLLSAAEQVWISYAQADQNNQDVTNQPSPLFLLELNRAEQLNEQRLSKPVVELERYEDVYGPAWHSPEKARGGSAIFKNQSVCAFKAFVTHQLRFSVDEDTEFGLDHLDRGNLTHKMLELIWGQLDSQATLCDLSPAQQTAMIELTFDRLLHLSAEHLPADKLYLFSLEKNRVVALCNEWLDLERERPTNFSVVERESKYHGQWAGIRFDYIIDRVDVTEAGQSVVVDYKTGTVNRNDWQGHRPREPQLPLYALVRDDLKASKVSGITFAQIRRGDSKFVELAEADIFRKASSSSQRYEQQWHESRSEWPNIFTQLANDFLSGKADVNPVDKQVCQYCDLSAVCRIQELSERSHGFDQSHFQQLKAENRDDS